jgi:RimJ/RimL family protein N-acetyltransferase
MSANFSFSPPPSFSIPTERLHISYIQDENPDHCAFIVRLWNTEHFIQSCGKTGIDTPEKASQFIKNRVQADYNRNKHGQFLVSLKPHPDASLAESKLIGMVSLMKGEPPNAYTYPDIGYTILPEENGKGYATEAAIGLLDYARRELNIDGVFGFCSEGNTTSRRVLEKIGLEFRGMRKLRIFGGSLDAVYALPEMNTDLTVYGIDD